MTIEGVRRGVREAWRGARSNFWMSFAAVSAVSITLFMFGIFLSLAFNLNSIITKVQESMSVWAELKPDTKPETRARIMENIRRNPRVALVEYQPKEEIIAKMRKKWRNSIDTEDSADSYEDSFFYNLDPSLFTDTFRIRLNNPDHVPAFKADMKRDFPDDIHKVRFTRQAKDVNALSTRINQSILIFSVILALLTSLLISNTVRLTIIARKSEIEIQRLVGASNWFIRWPFLVEGVLLGLVGAVVPTPLLLGLYKMVFVFLPVSYFQSFVQCLTVGELAYHVIPLLLLFGVFIGMCGSALSIRRFLRV